MRAGESAVVGERTDHRGRPATRRLFGPTGIARRRGQWLVETSRCSRRWRRDPGAATSAVEVTGHQRVRRDGLLRLRVVEVLVEAAAVQRPIERRRLVLDDRHVPQMKRALPCRSHPRGRSPCCRSRSCWSGSPSAGWRRSLSRRQTLIVEAPECVVPGHRGADHVQRCRSPDAAAALRRDCRRSRCPRRAGLAPISTRMPPPCTGGTGPAPPPVTRSRRSSMSASPVISAPGTCPRRPGGASAARHRCRGP